MTKPIVAFRQVCKRAWKMYLSNYMLGAVLPYSAHLQQECHNSKFGIFYFIETNVSRCTFYRYSVITQFAKSPLDRWYVVVAHIENFSTSNPLKKKTLKNHTFWVMTQLSQMSDILIWPIRVVTVFILIPHIFFLSYLGFLCRFFLAVRTWWLAILFQSHTYRNKFLIN